MAARRGQAISLLDNKINSGQVPLGEHLYN